MFIAHLPAAYLLRRLCAPSLSRATIAAFLVGSVAPDIDMFAFYLVDGQSVHHHNYITHRPALWYIVLGLGLVWHGIRRGKISACLIASGLGALLHLMLDSIAGQIDWGWPLWELPVTLVQVPATQSHWVLSFLTHWTFLNELIICAIAILVYRRTDRR